jgi:hypothetical protein
MIKNDTRGTCEMKCRVAMADAVFNKKKLISPANSTFNEEISKVLHLGHSFVWC